MCLSCAQESASSRIRKLEEQARARPGGSQVREGLLTGGGGKNTSLIKGGMRARTGLVLQLDVSTLILWVIWGLLGAPSNLRRQHRNHLLYPPLLARCGQGIHTHCVTTILWRMSCGCPCCLCPHTSPPPPTPPPTPRLSQIAQTAPMIDIHSMRPVAAVNCGGGIGLAVCPSLRLIVTSNRTDHSISAFELSAPLFQLLGTWGSRDGPLQFGFSSEIDPKKHHLSGGMCFVSVEGAAVSGGGGGGGGGGGSSSGGGSGRGGAVPAPRHWPRLLVASHGTDDVAVLDMSRVSPVSRAASESDVAPVLVGRFGQRSGAAPRCVAACTQAALVAVSGWAFFGEGDHTVTLYTAGSWAKLRVVGVGRGCGLKDGQLCAPLGLCFSRDGSRLFVADFANDRVCGFRVTDGAFAGVVATSADHGLLFPFDTVEVLGGVLVADTSNHRLVRVSADGSPTTVLGGVGCEPGQFKRPAAVRVLPSPDGPAWLIVRELEGGRFQVFR